MAKGNFISVMGIGDELFSEGMKELAAKVQSETNWNAHCYEHEDLRIMLKAFKGIHGPFVIAGHSKGASTINNFAKKSGLGIRTAIFVDAWLPWMKPYKHIHRVVSLKASTFGRFHVRNADMKVTIKASHTTIDNSQQFHELALAEIARLS